jgi:hypothetical protein
MLDKFPTLLARMQEMLLRFLGTVQAAHISFLDVGTFEGLTEPTTRGTRRLAGIDLNKGYCSPWCSLLPSMRSAVRW